MGLNTRQKQAVEYLNGPLLVLAGPGTGKTQLLSEKVAYILKNTDTNPENILCLTFTDSGAKNMRERLKTVIGTDALKVNIGTYHAFGQEILAQYKNYSLDYDRRLDNAIDEITQFKIIKEIQSKLPGTDILRGDKVKDIMGVINEAKAATLSAKDLRKIAEANLDDFQVISEALSPIFSIKQSRKYDVALDTIYRPIFEILNQYSNSAPIVPGFPRIITVLAFDLKRAIEYAETDKTTKPLTAWRNDYFEKDENGDFRLKGRVANKKLVSVGGIMEQYDQYLLENGLFDFNDMIEEAIKALKSDQGFKLTLEERYQYILLDEFQDTNPSQLAIVKELTDYEKPNIMAVGDDDQAIFEFQGALSTNLKDFRDYYNAEVVELTENYRSTQEILDYSTAIIKQADDRFQPNKTLTAHKENSAKSEIHRLEFVSSDAECQFVADKIAELIKSGVKQSEIAVISYKTKYFEPLLPFLKSHDGVKIAYEKRDNLFEDEKIHQILTILKYVYEEASEKRHSVQLMEIALYPFFDLPILETVKILDSANSTHENALIKLGESENAKIRFVAEFIGKLMVKSYTEPISVMLDYVIGVREFDGLKSPFMDYYEAHENDYGMFTIYENIASLRGRLESHYSGTERLLKVEDLIAMLNDYELADMALNTKSPYRDADEAVQILTAHKAKGLEFEYVFVLSADNNAWGKSKGNNTFLTLPKNLEKIRHTGLTDGERLRILYVALTRAKNCLYITNAVSDFTGRARTRLDYLKEHQEGDKVLSDILPEREVMVVPVENDINKRIRTLKDWLTSTIVESPDMRLYYQSKMDNFKMSASALTTFIDIIYGGPEAFFRGYVMNLREPKTEAMAFGTLMHKTFEKVTNDGISDEEAVKFYLDELEPQDIPSEDKIALRDRGVVNLEASLKEFGPIIRTGKAEINFGPEHLVINGVPVTGVIDHLVVDDKAKTIEIYDYKTGAYHPESWQSHPTLFMQMLQLIFYKMLLNNSREYRNYKVTTGHILYVVKDKEDDKVHKKSYVYNEKDEAMFMGLLTTIYNMVKDLSFLDDPEVYVSADKGNNMKAVKDFITLLLAKSTS